MSDPTEANTEPVEPAGGAGRRHVRVVLVDDHRMFRTGVQAEIGRTEETGVEVVGEAADVEQAVTVITATRPEVVLLDVHLPGGGGVEVLRRCAPLMADPEQPVRFLALSVSDAAEDVIGVIRGGARGYVTKTITGTDLVDSVFRVQEGDAVSWTPSPPPTPRRSTRTWTVSPSASARCCGSSRGATPTRRSPSSCSSR
jgi:DNA-binding NarL/FixJ family response regulator